MPDATPVDPADIEAGARALNRAWLVLGESSRRYLAKLVLAAVLPDHDARVRADERARVAEEVRHG